MVGDTEETARGEMGDTGGRSIWLNQRRCDHTLPTMPAPWMQAQQRSAKRHCVSEDGDSTNTSNSTDAAYGMTRKEMDELTVQVAQMVSIHDQQIRELQACTFRKIIMPATSKYGKSFIAVDTQWEKERSEGSKWGPWGANTYG